MAGFQWSDASIERPRKQQQPARHQHSGSHWVLGGGSRWGVQSCHAAFCCLLPGGGDGGQVPQLAPTLISSCGFAAGCCSRFHPVLVHGSQDCGLCSSAGRHRYVHPQRRKKKLCMANSGVVGPGIQCSLHFFVFASDQTEARINSLGCWMLSSSHVRELSPWQGPVAPYMQVQVYLAPLGRHQPAVLGRFVAALIFPGCV